MGKYADHSTSNKLGKSVFSRKGGGETIGKQIRGSCTKSIARRSRCRGISLFFSYIRQKTEIGLIIVGEVKRSAVEPNGLVRILIVGRRFDKRLLILEPRERVSCGWRIINIDCWTPISGESSVYHKISDKIGMIATNLG